MKPYLVYISLPHNSKEIYIKDELTDEVLVTVHNNDMELAKQIEKLMTGQAVEHA